MPPPGQTFDGRRRNASLLLRPRERLFWLAEGDEDRRETAELNEEAAVTNAKGDVVRMERTDCPACGSSRSEPLLEGPDPTGAVSGVFHVARCADCGLGYLNPRPAVEDLGAIYPETYSPRQRTGARQKARRKATGRVKRLLRLHAGYPYRGLEPGAAAKWLSFPRWLVLRLSRGFVEYLPWQGEGRLLDVGCGGGLFLALAEELGWRATGLEMDPEGVAHARAQGLEVAEGRLDDARFEPGSFDVVTFWHSLEHMPGPLEALATARELLAPGGYVVVAAPDVDSIPRKLFGPYWLGADLPRHLVFFNPGSLARLFERSGFEAEKVLRDRRVSGVKESLRRRPQGGGFLGKLWGLRTVQRLEGLALSALRATDFFVARARKR